MKQQKQQQQQHIYIDKSNNNNKNQFISLFYIFFTINLIDNKKKVLFSKFTSTINCLNIHFVGRIIENGY